MIAPNIWHKNLTQEKWQKYEKSKQILSIAAEFNRAKNMIKWQKFEEARNCYERTYELLDMTIVDPRWRHKLKELLRFREILGNVYLAPAAQLNEKLYQTLLKLNSEAYSLLNK